MVPPPHVSFLRFGCACLAWLGVAVLSGCAGKGERLSRTDLPADAPPIEAILHDLGSNEAAIESFRAAGSFTVESPKLTATQRFPIGHAKFQRPDRLYVQGQKRLGPIIFKLLSVGDAYLMEIPARQQDSFYQLEGDRYADVPFSVSPADVAREMFLPERWLDLRRGEVRLNGFDEAAQTAMLEVGPADSPRREITVARFGEAEPAWVVVRNVRFDDYGNVIARTALSEYREVDGIRFPSRIEADFPTEATRMIFELRNIRPNYEFTDADFDLEARIDELDLEPRQAL